MSTTVLIIILVAAVLLIWGVVGYCIALYTDLLRPPLPGWAINIVAGPAFWAFAFLYWVWLDRPRHD